MLKGLKNVSKNSEVNPYIIFGTDGIKCLFQLFFPIPVFNIQIRCRNIIFMKVHSKKKLERAFSH